MEIDCVVFLRGGDAAGEELPVLAVVVRENVLLGKQLAALVELQDDAVLPLFAGVQRGRVAPRRL